MEQILGLVGYRIWTQDNAVHGPLSYQELVRWVKKEKVQRNTWIYLEEKDRWQKASQLPELEKYFSPDSGTFHNPLTGDSPAASQVTREHLRQVKIFAGMDDEQLQRMVQYMEVDRLPAQTIIVSQGEPAEAMYIILEGEVRIRLIIAGRENLLTRLSAGDFFGEMALIDRGARSADVVTNTETLVAKIRASIFQRLVKDIPDLVMPLVWNIGKTLTARIRADNKRYLEATNFARITDL